MKRKGASIKSWCHALIDLVKFYPNGQIGASARYAAECQRQAEAWATITPYSAAEILGEASHHAEAVGLDLREAIDEVGRRLLNTEAAKASPARHKHRPTPGGSNREQRRRQEREQKRNRKKRTAGKPHPR